MIASQTIPQGFLQSREYLDPVSMITTLFQMDFGPHPHLAGMLAQALETACRAAEVNATSSMVTAALLHDVSHLIFVDNFDRIATRTCRATTLDHLHSSGTLQWLNQSFGHEVADPIRLQAHAVRFLCTTISGYQSSLSVQEQWQYFAEGGPMNDSELACFRRNRFCNAALQIRSWHDTSSDRCRLVPTIEHFVPYILASLKK